jgi:hypothetical protein
MTTTQCINEPADGIVKMIKLNAFTLPPHPGQTHYLPASPFGKGG